MSPQAAERLGLVLVLLAFLLLQGCQTVPRLGPVDASQPGWRTQQGQAVWRPSKEGPELAGELVFAMHPDGSSLFEFSKTPLPLVQGQIRSNAWEIEFPARKLRISGRGRPPERFLWLHLAEFFEGKPLPKKIQTTGERSGNWRLENIHTGESVEGYLVP